MFGDCLHTVSDFFQTPLGRAAFYGVIVALLAGLDCFYRYWAYRRIELVSLEVILFSLLITLHQVAMVFVEPGENARGTADLARSIGTSLLAGSEEHAEGGNAFEARAGIADRESTQAGTTALSSLQAEKKHLRNLLLKLVGIFFVYTLATLIYSVVREKQNRAISIAINGLNNLKAGESEGHVATVTDCFVCDVRDLAARSLQLDIWRVFRSKKYERKAIIDLLNRAGIDTKNLKPNDLLFRWSWLFGFFNLLLLAIGLGLAVVQV